MTDAPARRSLGQNFLVRTSAIHRIVHATGGMGSDRVLEIGPGRGALTAPLLERFGSIAAVEADRRLAARLTERFGDRLRLVHADVLRTPLAPLLAALERPGTPRRVVGNLPYNISKPIASKLVDERAAVDRAVLMFQREVAERLLASPGTSAYGPLTVLVGAAFDVRRLLDLPPAAFRPRPKVDSTVTVWTRRDDPSVDDAFLARLRAWLRVGFAARRKTLRANLRGSGRDVASLEAAGIDPAERAERVPPAAWHVLARED